MAARSSSPHNNMTYLPSSSKGLASQSSSSHSMAAIQSYPSQSLAATQSFSSKSLGYQSYSSHSMAAQSSSSHNNMTSQPSSSRSLAASQSSSSQSLAAYQPYSSQCLAASQQSSSHSQSTQSSPIVSRFVPVSHALALARFSLDEKLSERKENNENLTANLQPTRSQRAFLRHSRRLSQAATLKNKRKSNRFNNPPKSPKLNVQSPKKKCRISPKRKSVLIAASQSPVRNNMAASSVRNNVATSHVRNNITASSVINNVATSSVRNIVSTSSARNNVATSSVRNNMATSSVRHNVATSSVRNNAATSSFFRNSDATSSVSNYNVPTSSVRNNIAAASYNVATYSVRNNAATSSFVRNSTPSLFSSSTRSELPSPNKRPQRPLSPNKRPQRPPSPNKRPLSQQTAVSRRSRRSQTQAANSGRTPGLKRSRSLSRRRRRSSVGRLLQTRGKSPGRGVSRCINPKGDPRPTKGEPRPPKSESERREDLRMFRSLVEQTVFATARAKEAFARQRRKAESQFVSVAQQISSCRESLLTKKLKLLSLQHGQKVDQMLNVQSSSLEPLQAELATLRKTHPDLTQALYCTMHRVPTEGISVDHEQLTRELRRSKELLSAIQQETSDLRPQIVELSIGLESLCNVVSSEAKGLKNCAERLRTVDHLELKERSMRHQLSSSDPLLSSQYTTNSENTSMNL
eukprot:977997_1